MGILEELGLNEDDLDPSAYPPPVPREQVHEEVVKDEGKFPTLTPEVNPEAGEFFRQLREGKFDTPAHPMHPDESGTDEAPAKKKSKGKRVAYSVACTLHLSGSAYQVQLLPPSSDYDKAYRLNKTDAQKPTGYNVTQIDGDIICECHDFKFRQDGSDSKGCKHIKGLVDMGFFSAPSTSHRTGSGVFDG